MKVFFELHHNFKIKGFIQCKNALEQGTSGYVVVDTLADLKKLMDEVQNQAGDDNDTLHLRCSDKGFHLCCEV